MNYLDNWTDGNIAMVSVDDSPYNVWSDWDASQRDLFILDGEGFLVFHENITPGIDDSIYDLVYTLINDLNSNLIGDINSDGIVNVIDAVILINIILEIESPIPGADINGDEVINVLDVVFLVNIILSK